MTTQTAVSGQSRQRPDVIMSREQDALGGDQFGWKQVLAQSDEEKKEIIANLRANDMAVPRDLWEDYNETVMTEAMRSLNVVEELEGRGLTVDTDISFTEYSWPIESRMTPAETTMDARHRSEHGELVYGEASIPIPITRKDYDIPIRKLQQLQRGGTTVSTGPARMASRVVAEGLEHIVFHGWNQEGVETYRHDQAKQLYGLTTHPHRNPYDPAGGDGWADDPVQAVDDLNAMVGVLEDEYFEPNSEGYLVYMGPGLWKALRQDYVREADAGDKSLRDKVDEIPEIQEGNVHLSYELDQDELVMFRPTTDVVELVRDPNLMQNVQWESHGGMNNKYCVMSIFAPAIKSTYEERCGLVHATGLLG